MLASNAKTGKTISAAIIFRRIYKRSSEVRGMKQFARSNEPVAFEFPRATGFIEIGKPGTTRKQNKNCVSLVWNLQPIRQAAIAVPRKLD